VNADSLFFNIKFQY